MNRRERRQAARGARRSDGGTAGLDARRTLGQAMQQHQAGRLAEAEALYRRVLAAQSDNAEALQMLGVLYHQQDDPGRAIPLLERAATAAPDDPSCHYNLGEALRAANRLEDAATRYRRVLALAPEVADAHYGLGNALYELGNLEDAAACYRQAIKLSPGDPEALNNLGNVLTDLGRAGDAVENYRQALALAPDYADAHVNLGNALAATGEIDSALAHYRSAIDLAPDVPAGYLALGGALEAVGQIDEALASFQRALDVGADQASAHALMADACIKHSRWQDAETYAGHVLETEPNDVEALNTLGSALLEQGRPEEARAVFDRALALNPDSARTIANIGNCLQQQGAFDEAGNSFRRALSIDSGLAQAFLNLVSTRQAITASELGNAATQANDPEMNDESRTDLHFGLARLAEERADYDEAFTHYRAANDIRDRRSRFEAALWPDYIDRLIERHPRDFFLERGGFGTPSRLPVFVLGMPRSGTTLVEQIIASHPLAHGAGELYDMRDIVAALPAKLGVETAYPDCAGNIGRDMAAEIAGAHVSRLQSYAPEATRIVDKMPANFLRLGLIALLFPGAAIIHCRRDPMDTCLSCYFQNFRGLEFTTRLHSIGVFYREYRRLMDHWRDVLPVSMLEVDYETLVADQEAQTRRIIDFIGLDWDDRCLDFHKTERQIRTASVWQARQPIYTSSVARWRRYEAHLGPLKEALGPTLVNPSEDRDSARA